MEKSAVVLIRELITNGRLLLVGDNIKYYNNFEDGENLILDDTNGLCYSFRPAINKHLSGKGTEFTAFGYETIQYLTAVQSMDDTAATLDKLIAKGLITEEEKAHVLSDLNNAML